MLDSWNELGEGKTRRSGSMSDISQLNCTALTAKSNPVRPPGLITDKGLLNGNSVPDVSLSGPNNMDFLMWGISTRLQVVWCSGKVDERLQRATKNCTNLITDLETWIFMMKASPPPLLNTIILTRNFKDIFFKKV